MKLLVLVILAVVSTVHSATLSPRDEAEELLLETAELDESLQDKTASKRSYAPNGGYEPNFQYHEPQVPPYPAKAPAFDLWGFKRAILNALFQAVKAVAGGSIAIKGQLLKGGGNLLAAQGRLIASGGQTVSNFGRSVAHSALYAKPLLPAHPPPVAPGYGQGGYSSYPNGGHHGGPGVIESLHKAKVGVASAVGNAVAGAAGAVGSAVAGAAGAVAGAVSGAADAVSGHVAHKFTPTHQGYLPAPAPAPIAPIAYKPSSGYQAGILVVKPINLAEYASLHNPARPVDTATTYGGSLDESFGTADLGYNAFGGGSDFNIQPSISYDLH